MIRFGETETEQLPTPIPTEEVRVFLCPCGNPVIAMI